MEVEVDVLGDVMRGDKHMVMEMSVKLRLKTRTGVGVASYVMSHERAQEDHVCVVIKCGEMCTLRCTCAYVLTHCHVREPYMFCSIRSILLCQHWNLLSGAHQSAPCILTQLFFSHVSHKSTARTSTVSSVS